MLAMRPLNLIYISRGSIVLFSLLIIHRLANIQFVYSLELAMELLLLCSSSLLLLLLSSHGMQSTEGGELHHHQIKEPPPEVEQTGGKGWAAMSEALIGSRPPRCEGKCAPCGRCEAVQVPVAPHAGRLRAFFFSRAAAAADDDESSTNYKPLNWKCRCADTRRALDP
ncbi:EPIDERMAL PATTERNING FACTOR-like protein 2 isoform X2 [Oryza glaberrima]|uniref:EPIDERMAL PATTERNING FACTOR-like protein 2 isoform X2 n=1 Tax=Oryza glaberrima TaxID=4538 RepID=UPI00224C08FA|nr:EPIDERMAL PATTERNING FACTOR-like protein 2 isoform X2 [Oryza glaberrima]